MVKQFFLFEMSYHTSHSIKYSRLWVTFSPVQSNFRISLSITGLGAVGTATYFATYLYQVLCVTEVCMGVQAYLFPLHITWQRLGSYSIEEFRKEKINTSDLVFSWKKTCSFFFEKNMFFFEKKKHCWKKTRVKMFFFFKTTCFQGKYSQFVTVC